MEHGRRALNGLVAPAFQPVQFFFSHQESEIFI
jgi:hypothetical protein